MQVAKRSRQSRHGKKNFAEGWYWQAWQERGVGTVITFCIQVVLCGLGRASAN